MSTGLKSIVADLHDLGYSDAEIAVVVGRTPQRVGQIIAEVCPRPPRIASIADLPHALRTRIELWKQTDDDHLSFLKVTITQGV
jgi:hypothetical protein